MAEFREFYWFHFTSQFFIFCLKMELFGSVFQLWSMLAEQNGPLGSTGCIRVEFASAYGKFCITYFFIYIFKCLWCLISGGMYYYNNNSLEFISDVLGSTFFRITSYLSWVSWFFLKCVLLLVVYFKLASTFSLCIMFLSK
jgi:hypothetical protein